MKKINAKKCLMHSEFNKNKFDANEKQRNDQDAKETININ